MYVASDFKVVRNLCLGQKKTEQQRTWWKMYISDNYFHLLKPQPFFQTLLTSHQYPEGFQAHNLQLFPFCEFL